jgi:hypothetical protein
MNSCYYHQDLHYSTVLLGSHHAFNPKSTSPYTALKIEMQSAYQEKAAALSIFRASSFGR